MSYSKYLATLKRRTVFLLALVCTLYAAPVSGQLNGLHIIGHLYSPHGRSPQKTEFSSCWGWVSPDGKEYAFVSTYTGTSIVDLNADTMKEIQFVPGPPSGYCYREVKTYKHYAYIVTDYPTTLQPYVGIQILDLSGLPDTVIHVKDTVYVDPVDTSRNLRTSHTLSYADGYLYCNGSTKWGPDGTVILSLLNDPLNPELAGSYEPQYLHDTYIRHDTLYGAAIATVGGLYVVDIKDKLNPVLLGKISYSGSGTHNAWASIDGHYAFTADEVGGTTHDMKVWALDSLPNSVKVAEWSADPTQAVHNVYGRGHYIYAAHYKVGMHVLDIHHPTTPFEVGSYDTYAPGNDSVAGQYAGCWAMFPYFPSGRIIGSDMQSGLFLATFDSLKPRVRSGLIEPSDNATTGSLTFRWRAAANQLEDPHNYLLHLQGGAIDTTFRTTDTSFTLPGPGSRLASGSYRWFVMITDEFTEVSSKDTFQFTYQDPLDVKEPKGILKTFLLHQNYPNPFNPTTEVSFDLRSASGGSFVSLKVYDVLGREVATLVDGRKEAGEYVVTWNAEGVPSGVYFYRMVAGDFVQTRMMTIIR